MTARQAAPLITAALLLAMIVAAFAVAGGGPARAGLPAVASMSLDMDPDVGGSDPNTATSIGERQNCARLNANGSLDADEDAVDTVQFDVTVEGIPPYDDGGTPSDTVDDSGAMAGFSFKIAYDEAAFTIERHDPQLLAKAKTGSSVSDVSQTLPDPDDASDQVENSWIATVVDLGSPLSAVAEDGNGVLDRIEISADDGIAPDVYRLNLINNVVLDVGNNALPTTEQRDGWIAVDQDCTDGLDEEARTLDVTEATATAVSEATGGGGNGGDGGGGVGDGQAGGGSGGDGTGSAAGPESGIGALAPAAAAAPAWGVIASGLGAAGLFGGAGAFVAGRLRRRGR
jgi:hypothetical protein